MSPFPIAFDVKKHIAQLKEGLDPTSQYYQHEGQHVSIRTFIKLYESGQRLDDREEIWIVDGEVTTMEKARASPKMALFEKTRRREDERRLEDWKTVTDLESNYIKQ